MKKSLLLISLISLTLLSFGQSKKNGLICTQPSQTTKSTTAEWAQVVDFTSTDIDGVEHHLQSYLDAGKYVIVDLSATWCPPCWNLHQSGVFEDLHNNYGPDGTDELVVLWVENDASTTLADIEGTGSNTQGDWTNGGDFPVPIIDDASITASFSELYENAVPTVFMVCPSGMYKDVTEEAWTSATAVYNTITGCPDENNDMEMTSVSTTNSTTDCALGANENVVIEITNIGIDDVSNVDVSYTINGGTAVTETIAGPIPATETSTYTFNQTEDLSAMGAYEIEATVNWPEDPEPANNTKTGMAISGDSEITLDLTTDDYPGETSWDIVDNATGTVIAESPVYEGENTSYTESICILSSNCYTFTIYDEYGDGICCSYGDGSYTLTVDGTQVGSGGDFDSSESVEIDAQTPGFSDLTFCTGETIDWDTNVDGTFSALPGDIDNSTTGEYTITYTINEGETCEASETFTVSVVDDIITLDITPEDITVCQGDSINFPTGFGTFSPATVDNSTIGTTTVTYYISQGTYCENSTTFDVTVLEAPDASITQDGFVLSTTASGDLQWYLNGDPIEGATESTYTCTEDGDYYMIATGSNDCTDQSNTISISGTDVESHSLADFKIYPNPAVNQVYIEVPQNSVHLSIYDITGKVLIKKDDFNTSSLDISVLNAGVYMIEIQKDNAKSVRKLLVK